MFVVTPEGVIATDPIAYLRPQAAKAYIDEIRKITAAPIKYVVYSHHHYDHAAGGSPFKELGATFIAHRNAKMHLEQLKFADIVMPDVLVDDKYVIELGGIRVELYYVGRNHSDNASASTGGAGINHVIPTNTRNLPASDSQNPAACPSRRGSEPAT